MSRLGTVGLCALVVMFFASVVQAAESDPFADSDDAAAPAAAAEDEGDDAAMADDATENEPTSRPIEVGARHEALARAKIQAALDSETSFDVTELPLTDVVRYLSDKHGIEIQLDAKVMEGASIGIDTPVTRSLKGVTLRSALRLMLGPLDLAYVIKDEVLLITATRWAQTPRPIEVGTPHEAETRATIQAALDSETSFEFTELPLTDVIKYLSDKHDIEIQLDSKVLEEASIGIDMPVTRSVHGITLRSALRLMLGAMDLAYVFKDEELLITTTKAAENAKMVRIYPIGDLIASDATDKQGQEVAALIEIVKGSVEPKSWRGSGDTEIQPWALGLALVIRQASAAHEEIESLLAGLRRAQDIVSVRHDNKAVVSKKRGRAG